MTFGSTYLVVTDMDRSVGFYQTLFQAPPSWGPTRRWAQFTLGGACLALLDGTFDRWETAPGDGSGHRYSQAYRAHRAARPFVYGSNTVVLNFGVEDLFGEYRRLREAALGPLTRPMFLEVNAPYHFFQLTDPDGNTVEVTGGTGGRLFETPRLALRWLVPGDLGALTRLFSQSAVARWMGDGKVLTREQCARWIEVSHGNYETRGYGACAAVDRTTGEFVGCAGIVHDGKDAEPEVIYAFEPSYWGRGWAGELLPALVSWGFAVWDFPRLLATIDAANTASCRAAERAGFVLDHEEPEDGSVTLVYVASPASV